MASFSKFNNTVQNFGAAQFNFASDSMKAMLSNTVPVATNSAYSDVSGTELANGNGYATGGLVATFGSWTNSSGTSKLILTSAVLTASGAVGPFRYVVLYDVTSGKLIGWWDYGSSISLANTDTFTPTYDASNGVLQLV